jgi:predicted nucleic acid-binding Zn ribbon protein
VVKLLSAPGFRLKGSGWYETDFKDKNKKNVHRTDNSNKKLKKDN